MSSRFIAGVTAIALGLVAANARGQDYMGPSIDYVGNHISASQFRRQIERSQVPPPGPAKRTTAAATREPSARTASVTRPASGPETMRALSFAPSAAASTQIQAAMANALAGNSTTTALPVTRLLHATFKEHPRFRTLLAAQLGGDETKIRDGLRAGVLQAAFQQELARYGYSATNMGDVNNAYMIHAWGLTNNVGIDRGAVFAGQRAKLEKSIKGGLRAPAIDDAGKQEFCEVVGMLTMLTGAAWNKAAAGERLVLQAGMRDIARRMGLDLRAVKLTSSGFSG